MAMTILFAPRNVLRSPKASCSLSSLCLRMILIDCSSAGASRKPDDSSRSTVTPEELRSAL